MSHFSTLIIMGPPHHRRDTATTRNRILSAVPGPILLAVFCAAMFWGMAEAGRANDVDEAYLLNQEAMVDMSQALFKSAARKFLEAAAIVPDYQIRGRKLRYTPTFMAAWAFEKIGKAAEACRYFKNFLLIAPVQEREPTKAEHAQNYLNRYCGP